MNILIEFLSDSETTEEYNGYICSVKDAVTIVILGSICGLKNVNRYINGHLMIKLRNF